MRQIYYIIQREIVTNIRKPSFLLFTILSPVVFMLPFIFFLFTSNNVKKPGVVAIIDNAHLFSGLSTVKLNNSQAKIITGKIDQYKLSLIHDKIPLYYIIIDLPSNLIEGNSILPIRYYTTSTENLNTVTTQDLENLINNALLKAKSKSNISFSQFSFKKLYGIVVTSKSNVIAKLASTLAYVIGMLMYLMFIIFNNSLLRGVLEEKSNRIVEVFSMVVNPFNLMIGKILGVGAIALLQFVAWISLSLIYLKIINYIGVNLMHIHSSSSSFSVQNILGNLTGLPIYKMVIFTPLFFICGFLLNGAITTVVGATADIKGNSSLSLVSNVLNIGSIYIAMFSAALPDNAIAKAALYIPFFSPIVLPALLPYNLPTANILLSLAIIIVTFIFLVYVAGKIYRISIISYGNKISFKDMIHMIANRNI